MLHHMPCGCELKLRGRLGTGGEGLASALDLCVMLGLTCINILVPSAFGDHVRGKGTRLAWRKHKNAQML